MSKEYKFSIIIPHHNIPELLERCLASIPSRDDIQVIIIDDNSDSNKVDFDKFPGLIRENTEVFFLKESKGGGGARNVGLGKAKGDWVLFVDADDYFMYAISSFLDRHRDSQADIVYFNAISLDTDLYLNAKRADHLQKMMSRKCPDTYLRYMFGEPWCKMIKRELIESNNISFEETKIHNDTYFSYMVGHCAKIIEWDNVACYCVTDRLGSVSKQLDDERILTRIRVFAEREHFLKQYGIRGCRYPAHWFQLAEIFGNNELYRTAIEIIKKIGFSERSIIYNESFFLLKRFVKLILGKR